jgi:thymidylate synthase
MKLEFIEATTLPDSWFQCISRIQESGRKYTVDRGSFAGQQRLEFDYVTVHIKYPGVRPLLPDIPPGLGIPNPVAEGYLEQYLPYLMTPKTQPGEDYTYGERLSGFLYRVFDGVSEDFFVLSQIDEVVKMYKEQGFGTNQACMEVGMPKDILLNDPPCLRLIDTRVQDGKLNFVVYFRSWDLWSGYPANLGAIQLMKEYMSAEIGVEDGEIIAMSKGMHLYDFIWDIAKLRTCRT